MEFDFKHISAVRAGGNVFAIEEVVPASETMVRFGDEAVPAPSHTAFITEGGYGLLIPNDKIEAIYVRPEGVSR